MRVALIFSSDPQWEISMYPLMLNCFNKVWWGPVKCCIVWEDSTIKRLKLWFLRLSQFYFSCIMTSTLQPQSSLIYYKKNSLSCLHFLIGTKNRYVQQELSAHTHTNIHPHTETGLRIWGYQSLAHYIDWWRSSLFKWSCLLRFSSPAAGL